MENPEVTYEELKTFLKHMPETGYTGRSVTADYNDLVTRLGQECDINLDTYKLVSGNQYGVDDFFLKGSCVLTRVNEIKGFESGNPTFRSKDSAPSIAMNQTTANTQSVSTTVIVSVVSEITEHLTRAEAKFPEDSKERTFIDMVKAGIKGVKNAAEVISMILATAAQLRLTIDQVKTIFH